MKKWKVCSHHLAYYEGSGTIHHPSAIDIFGFQQDEGFEDMVSVELGLSFSRLCAKLECQVSFDEEIRFAFDVAGAGAAAGGLRQGAAAE